MKLKYNIVLFLIILLIFFMAYSKREKKSEQYVNYFTSQEKMTQHFAKDYKKAKDKVAQEKDLKELSQDLDQLIYDCKKNRDKFNKLPTPIELIDYNTATNEYMNTVIANIRDIKLVIDRHDLEEISRLDQKFQEMDKTNAAGKKEMDKAIEKAAKEAGIELKKEGDRVLFKVNFLKI